MSPKNRWPGLAPGLRLETLWSLSVSSGSCGSSVEPTWIPPLPLRLQSLFASPFIKVSFHCFPQPQFQKDFFMFLNLQLCDEFIDFLLECALAMQLMTCLWFLLWKSQILISILLNFVAFVFEFRVSRYLFDCSVLVLWRSDCCVSCCGGVHRGVSNMYPRFYAVKSKLIVYCINSQIVRYLKYACTSLCSLREA